MDILVSVVLPLALAFIMFSLGLGLTLADFRRVATQPRAFAIGALAQVILLPIVAFTLVVNVKLAPGLAVGVMILAFCPGGVTSNLMTKLARGDVALSVSLTAVVSLLSILTVPGLITLVVGMLLEVDAPPVNLAGLAIAVFLLTTLPVCLGIALRHFAPGFVSRAERGIAAVALGLFVVLVLAALASNWSLFLENVAVLGPVLIALNAVMLALGWALAKISGLASPGTRTVAIEAGVQNASVGIALGTIVAVGGFGGQAETFSEFSLPSAVYGITMYLVTLPAIALFRRFA